MSEVESEVRSPRLEDLQSIPDLDGRERIARLIVAEPNYRVLFDRMMGVVRDFVPFDWAYLFIFTPGREYSRLVCRYGPNIEFESRWFETGEKYRDFITGEETWIDDLESFLAKGPHPELLQRRDYRISIDAGVKALVCLPVQEGGKVIGGFCVQSKEVGKYKKEDRRKLERLMLGQALLPVFHAAECEERKFVSNLTRKIAESKNSATLAQTVVHEIARFYEFQNVSIFKLDASSRKFRLLAQNAAFIPEDYGQDFEEGLLGETYRRGSYVLVKDVKDGSPEAQKYVSTSGTTRSELCIPIKLSGRIMWILNLEDPHIEAFTLGEVETLTDIIEQMQANLDRIFQRLVLVQVLEVVPQAVVITKQNGDILHCTKDALEMLELERIPAGDNFSNYLRGPAAAAGFSALRNSQKMLKVVGANGNVTPVLAQKFTLEEEEYDYAVVVLQDLNEIHWKRDSQQFTAALSEAVAQVRVPVSLVSSFVRQIDEKIKDKKLQDLTKKAINQLDRIELTYDRVLASYEAQILPTARNGPVDVNVILKQIISQLPRLERPVVRWSPVNGPVMVNADPSQVFFALNSMIAYLLRSRANEEPIVVNAGASNGAVEVSMTGAVRQTPPLSDLAALVENTRTQISLGERALRRIAKDCAGTFDRQHANGHEQLSLSLAAAT
jgi:putative methionine-R-sulfoxide reductase with GAF domain